MALILISTSHDQVLQALVFNVNGEEVQLKIKETSIIIDLIDDETDDSSEEDDDKDEKILVNSNFEVLGKDFIFQSLNSTDPSNSISNIPDSFQPQEF